MNTSNETRAFLALFLELDGSLSQQRQDVTEAAIEVLFDRVLNPPMLDNEMPTLDDVEAAERQLIALVKAEATRLRDYIREAEATRVRDIIRGARKRRSGPPSRRG
jgi:hypothetical protein